MLSLTTNQCQSPGKLRASATTNATFDNSLGMAKFSNFYIDNAGMYIVVINVRATQNSDFNFNCLSEPIIVKKSVVATTVDTSGAPNMYFNFTGDFTSLSSDDIKQIKRNFYNCIIFQKNLVTTDNIQVYKGFYYNYYYYHLLFLFIHMFTIHTFQEV